MSGKDRILFYDCEIARCIPDKYEDDLEGYEYCDGQQDFQGMGLACIGTFWNGQYKAYFEDSLPAFQEIVNQAETIVGFNSVSFDDELMEANGIKIKTTYDLLCEVRVASGQPPFYTPGLTRGGYSLNALAAANIGKKKTGSGALAPILWQQGKKDEVVEYCLNDVDLTLQLYFKRHHLIDPTNGTILKLR